MNDRPPASRFRLSLRAFMVIVLVTGGIMGWKANLAHSQRRAVEAIMAINGRVVYDFQNSGNDVLTPTPMSPRKEPSAPKWLRNVLGDEYFQEVTMVIISSAVSDEILPTIAKLDHLVTLSLNMSKLDDSALAQVAKFPSLQSLSLSHAAVTDAGIAYLAGARKLRRLGIFGGAGVTDAGMASLAGLSDLKSLEILGAPKLTALGLKNLGPTLANLETLVVYQTALTDEGMACLDNCRKLKILSLSSAKIGDAGFAHFRNMKSLKTLVVGSTEVTDEGLASLRGLKNLRSLSLGNTRVSDSGLASLEGLVDLENLMLQETKITDEGMDHIRKLKGLKYLAVGAHVSPRAIAALQAERPSLRISSGPPAPLVRPKPTSMAPPASTGK